MTTQLYWIFILLLTSNIVSRANVNFVCFPEKIRMLTKGCAEGYDVILLLSKVLNRRNLKQSLIC